jgi:hypothetical protein
VLRVVLSSDRGKRETHREVARARDARGAAERGRASAKGSGEHRAREVQHGGLWQKVTRQNE